MNEIGHSLIWRQRMVFLIFVRTIFSHCWHHFYDRICGLDQIHCFWSTLTIGGKTKQKSVNKWKMSNQFMLHRRLHANRAIHNDTNRRFSFSRRFFWKWKVTQTKSRYRVFWFNSVNALAWRRRNKKSVTLWLLEYSENSAHAYLRSWLAYNQKCRQSDTVRVTERIRETEKDV